MRVVYGVQRRHHRLDLSYTLSDATYTLSIRAAASDTPGANLGFAKRGPSSRPQHFHLGILLVQVWKNGYCLHAFDLCSIDEELACVWFISWTRVHFVTESGISSRISPRRGVYSLLSLIKVGHVG